MKKKINFNLSSGHHHKFKYVSAEFSFLFKNHFHFFRSFTVSANNCYDTNMKASKTFFCHRCIHGGDVKGYKTRFRRQIKNAITQEGEPTLNFVHPVPEFFEKHPLKPSPRFAYRVHLCFLYSVCVGWF